VFKCVQDVVNGQLSETESKLKMAEGSVRLYRGLFEEKDRRVLQLREQLDEERENNENLRAELDQAQVDLTNYIYLDEDNQILLIEKEEEINEKDIFIAELTRKIGDLNHTIDVLQDSDQTIRWSEYQQLVNLEYAEELERCLHLAVRPEVDFGYFRQQARKRYQAIEKLDYIPIDPRMRRAQ